MTHEQAVHLPQIEYFCTGYVYPFIGKADLRTLIQMRYQKIHSDTSFSYSKEARRQHMDHLSCIEECIRILFSNPTSDFPITTFDKKPSRK